MRDYTRSDLACEAVTDGAFGEEGVRITERAVGKIRVSRVLVESEDAVMRLKKPKGTYVTLHTERMDRLSVHDGALLSRLIAGELRGMAGRLAQRAVDSSFCVFVAGLGNAELTADAIGPLTVARLTATRHLRTHEETLFRAAGCAEISALAPGVLGQTGIETAELLRGIVGHVRPHLVLVVDALAARSCERLSSTVQISDVGIEPGAGVGNHRTAIDRGSLGVPVIALGVPTVVDSATLVYDALASAGIGEIDASLQRVLKSGESFFVSPKESDVISARIAQLLAEGISLAFAGELAE